MSQVVMTEHGYARLSQRGIAQTDIDLLMLIGTEVDDGHFVRERDYQAFERELMHVLHRARRLIGKRLVVADGRVVTAYHANRKTERRLLRAK